MIRAQAADTGYYVGIDFGTSGARICAVNGVHVTFFRVGILWFGRLVPL